MNSITKVLGALLLIASGVVVRCADPAEASFPILTNTTANIGLRFRNLYATASKDQAEAKLQALRNAGKPTTFKEFLGRGLVRASIVSSIDEPVQASQLIRGLLDSIILQPGIRGGPTLSQTWAEGTLTRVRAYLEYDNGRVGIMESDGTHLFFEDGDGTYWWHRWDASFPRKIRDENSQPAVGGNAE